MWSLSKLESFLFVPFPFSSQIPVWPVGKKNVTLPRHKSAITYIARPRGGGVIFWWYFGREQNKGAIRKPLAWTVHEFWFIPVAGSRQCATTHCFQRWLCLACNEGWDMWKTPKNTGGGRKLRKWLWGCDTSCDDEIMWNEMRFFCFCFNDMFIFTTYSHIISSCTGLRMYLYEQYMWCEKKLEYVQYANMLQTAKIVNNSILMRVASSKW